MDTPEQLDAHRLGSCIMMFLAAFPRLHQQKEENNAARRRYGRVKTPSKSSCWILRAS